MVHSQLLVIRPKSSNLEEVMYPYQEVDKTHSERLADDRCQFLLQVSEEEIPVFIKDMGLILEERVNGYLELIQYRSNHSCIEFEKKYGESCDGFMLNRYLYNVEILSEYEKIKDLPTDNPEQIKFLKKWMGFVMDKESELYIPGVGYGYFDNPYQMWDFYTIIDEHLFPRGTKFLVGNTGREDNEMDLDSLNMEDTLENIYNLTRFWRYIIFCEDNPMDSKVYTTDDIRFGDSWNRHCLVKDLARVLIDLQEKNYGKGYIVNALDFHW